MTNTNQAELDQNNLPHSSPAPEDENSVNATVSKKINTVVYLVYLLLIILGVGTGYLLHRTINSGGALGGDKVTMTKSEKVEGVSDTATFKDWAEGAIEKGGIEDEGTHKLIREGGPSQTVVLVSSVLDLDEYTGKKVKVWGQTFPPQKAGWFMDVGKIELLE